MTEAQLHQRAEEHAREMAMLKVVRGKLRKRFQLLAYATFAFWFLGSLITIFSKGITRPWEAYSVGTPYGLGLLALSIVLAVLTWRTKMRLGRLITTTRERTAELKGGNQPPPA